MTLGVHHLAVVVRDLSRAEAFYAGTLGLVVSKRWQDETGAPRSVWCALASGIFLALERAEGALPTRGDTSPGWHCVALTIEAHERESWRARLLAAGHPIERESDYTLYVRDPDGNLVGLSHYPVACAS